MYQDDYLGPHASVGEDMMVKPVAPTRIKPVNAGPPVPLAQRMALDWNGLYGSLTGPAKQTVDGFMSLSKDGTEAQRRVTNVAWMAEEEKLPIQFVADNYETVLASHAVSRGWGDAGMNESQFFGKVVEEATHRQKKAQRIRGYSDKDHGAKPSTEEQKKMFDDSLQTRAFQSATEETKQDDPFDVASDYFKYQAEFRGKEGWKPGDEAEMWENWKAAYAAGEKAKRKAIRAAEKVFPIVSRGGDIGGPDLEERVLPAFKDLTTPERALALGHLNEMSKTSGGQSGVDVAGQSNTGVGFFDSAVKMGSQMTMAAGRTQSNMWDNAIAMYTRDPLGGGEVRAGMRMDPEVISEGPAAMVKFYRDNLTTVSSKKETVKANTPTWRALTESEAKSVNEYAVKRQEDVELLHNLRELGQSANAFDRSGSMPAALTKMALLGLAESVPAMAYTITPFGAPVRMASYEHEAYMQMRNQGVSMKDAEKVAPFIGAAQAGLDHVGLSFLTKNPVTDAFFKKYAQPAITKGLIRFGSTTAIETGIELGQDIIAPEAIKEAAQIIFNTGPGGQSLEQIEERLARETPATAVSMVLLSALGASKATIDDYKNPKALFDPKAMEALGIPLEHIEAIGSAKDPAKQAEIFKDGYQQREVAETPEAGQPSDGIASDATTTPSGSLSERIASEDTAGDSSVVTTSPDIEPELRGAPAASIQETAQDEAEVNAQAGVMTKFRDENGWHLTKENGEIIDGGTLEATEEIREEMALTNLRKEAAKEREKAESIAEKAKEQNEPIEPDEKDENESEQIGQGRETLLTPLETKESPEDQSGDSNETASTASSEAPATGSSAPAVSDKVGSTASNVNTEKGDAGGVPEDDKISIQNAYVDRDRAQRGLPPLMEPLQRAWGSAWQDAMRLVAANDKAGERLGNVVLANPARVVTDTEHALLLHEYAKRRNAYDQVLDDKIAASADPEKAAEIDKELTKRRNELLALGNATKFAGTAVARSLNIRKMLKDSDESMEGAIREMKAALGVEELPPEIEKEIVENYEKQAAIEREIAKEEAKAANAATDAEVEQFTKKVVEALEKDRKEANAAVKKGTPIRDFLKEKAAEARKRITERRQKAGAGQGLLDPGEFRDLVIIAAHDIARGVGKLADLTAALVKIAGERIKPVVGEIIDQAKEMLEGIKDTPEQRMGKAKARAVVDAAAEGADILPKQGTVYAMARAHVAAGVHGAAKIMAATHKSLLEFFPKITERQVRDIYTGYGKRILPSRDAIATELRETRQLMLLESQLDDLKANTLPAKSGPQRDKPTPEIRAKQKEVRDLRRKLNLPTTDPEAQLKSSLDAVVTRLENEITDLDSWIKKGGRTADEKAPREGIKYSEEANALLESRNALKKTLAEIEKKDITDDQRADAVMSGLKDIEEELTRRIVASEWVRSRKPSETITNSEIEEKRSLIEGMRLAIKEEQDALKVTKSPVEKAMDRAIKSLEHYTAIMEGRKDQKGKEPTKAMSQAEEDIRLQIKAMQDVLAQERRDAKPKTPEDEKQLKQAEKTLENLLAEIAGEKQPKSKKSAKEPLSEEETDVRGAILTAKEELKAIREAWKVKPNEVLARQLARQKYLQSHIKAAEKRLADKDFDPKPKKAPPTDPVIVKLEYDLRELQKEITRGIFNAQLARRTPTQRNISTVREILNTFRAFQTGFDVSAVLRQGGFVSLGHPFMALKALPKMFRAFRSERHRLAAEMDLYKRENYVNGTYHKAGLELVESGEMNLAKMEENWMGRWINDPPKWVKKIGFWKIRPASWAFGLVRGSARAYTTFLNELRADSFDTLLANLTLSGEGTAKEKKVIAHYVNVATGRGTYPSSRFDQAAIALNTIFFAPKYVASRFQLLFGNPLWDGTARTRKLVAAEYARWFMGASVIFGLYALFHAGDDDDKDRVEFNPLSSRFGKLKVGNTFIDPLSGLSQVTTFVSRAGPGLASIIPGVDMPGWYKDSSGRVKSLDPDSPGHGSFDMTFGTVLWNFFRSKLSPIAGGTLSGYTREDFTRERTSLFREYTTLWVPLSVKDIIDTVDAQGWGAIPISILSMFGMSVQNYDQEHEEAIDSKDANWLYEHELQLDRMYARDKVDSVLGYEGDDPQKRVTDKQREEILKRSLPAVSEAIKEARKSAKDLPEDPALREEAMGEIQKELNTAVKDARRDAFEAMLKTQ